MRLARKLFKKKFQNVTIIFSLSIFFLLGLEQNAAFASDTEIDSPQAIKQAYESATSLMLSRQFLKAAPIFFNIYTAPDHNQRYASYALGLLTECLIQAGLPNTATYFFIKTLKTHNQTAIVRLTPYVPVLLDSVGGDLLKKYLVEYTNETQYSNVTKSHFNYFLGKDFLLKGSAANALNALLKVSSGAGITAQAAYLRGVSYAMLGQAQNARSQFESCRKLASKSESRIRSLKNEYFDLEARCTASLARTYYQMGDHDRAEEIYDEIAKSSFVWTDILFEQAWNSYAKGDYNRALGKLVTYRAPSLRFVFNPEIDVLRAQSYLALCLYGDVNQVVNDFNSQYSQVGLTLKNFLLKNENDLSSFYGLAKQAFYQKLHTSSPLNRALNRSIRGPYFASLLAQENAVKREMSKLKSLSRSENAGFYAFLDNVIAWRLKSVHWIGGAFVKNSMQDLYQSFLSDLDKISYLKLEMLKQTKTTLEQTISGTADANSSRDSGRGDMSIDRKDYQFFWTFNGEFWIDELGDYVFALESKCRR